VSYITCVYILPDSAVGLAQPINIEGPYHLPTDCDPLVCCLQYTGLPTVTKSDSSNDGHHLSSSAAIRESTKVLPSTISALLAPKTPPPAPPKTPSPPIVKKVQVEIGSPSTLRQRSAHQRRHADAFLYAAKEIVPEPMPLVLPAETVPKGPVLISIGPNTDAILDRFDLGDKLLPSLHSLVSKVRSSCWEAALQSSPWNLLYEQASNLAGALVADLRGNNFSVTPVSLHPDSGLVLDRFTC
jgi:hypothetical protein